MITTGDSRPEFESDPPVVVAGNAHPSGAPEAASDGRNVDLIETKRGPWWAYLQALGPGLVTGASDDDPSGIATYAQSGAQFGFGMLWVSLITLPLMAGVQEICDRTALATGKGLGELITVALCSRPGDSPSGCSSRR